ncbi:MAG: hypothetical protein ACT6S0_03230 [Roseateles sp.]|uniref:hypothetical protein n=1 Tax=Roseateles sp. TaxID=1971397 RepID=UPI004036FBF5
MIDVFPNGRVLRSAGFLRTELEVVADLCTFNGLMATVGLLREAELYQDSIAYRRGYELLLGQLHLLPVAFGSKVLADRFAEFLRRRFCSMTIILEGAYEGKPRALGAAAQAFPVRLRPPDPVNAESLFRVKAEWCGYTSETIQALTDMWRDSMKQVKSPPGDRRRRRSLLKKR